LEAAEKDRHQRKAGHVETAQQREIGLVDIDRHPHDGRDQEARHDVDEEQPMPGESIGQKAADGRAHRPGKVEDYRDDHHQGDQRRPAEFRVDHRPYARRDRPAAEPLHRAVEDHLAEAGGGGAQRARTGETECRDDEQNAGRQ
jgi:hypothetical protein